MYDSVSKNAPRGTVIFNREKRSNTGKSAGGSSQNVKDNF